jgi:hypothetical protein
MDDELPALRTVQRGRQGDLHAKFIGLVRLALANALHFRRMQAEDPQIDTLWHAFDRTQVLVPGMDAAHQHQLLGKNLLEAIVTRDLAGDVAEGAAEIGLQRFERSLRSRSL